MAARNPQIGGDFELPIGHLFWRERGIDPGIFNNGPQSLLMSRGRGSIRFILEKLARVEKGSQVLLPAYLFNGLLSPFKDTGMVLNFYKLNPDLSIDGRDIRLKINSATRVLYLIHYFGFPQPTTSLSWVKKEFPNCIVIEDLAQALGTACLDKSLGTFGDFAFNNLIKFGAFPDGSVLTANKQLSLRRASGFDLTQVIYVGVRYWAMIAKGIHLKSHILPKSLHLALFRYAHRLAEAHPLRSGMSPISRWLMRRADFKNMVSTRVHNFCYLLDRWDSPSLTPMFSSLPGNVCPLGFIVLTNDRDLAVKKLSQSGIFCPIHWSPSARVQAEAFPRELDSDHFPISRNIARSILMIPIDQRYDGKEMDYILDKVKKI